MVPIEQKYKDIDWSAGYGKVGWHFGILTNPDGTHTVCERNALGVKELATYGSLFNAMNRVEFEIESLIEKGD